ncbi:fungal-specific transcription factor domain-containing protein [Amylocarpus encephaloides]|uniref:Fungal-specific transcription factor domain-containing protein n=1 Tax=Amylocarpus encephaloides TaxID=45428 RepID=A0A9P7Y8B7_9HELO|nr:fungal-specific transcription factor domain-containing protein [Amylocarpus encephaloides]
MLIYTKRAAPKEPKRRSRAGCISCKEKKKKCNENRPRCDRCTERGLQCEYEAVQPRKRRRSSLVRSAEPKSPGHYHQRWIGRQEAYETKDGTHDEVSKWVVGSEYQYSELDTPTIVEWERPWEETTDDVEEIIRADPPPSAGSLVRSRSQCLDLAMIAPSPIASPLLEFNTPLYSEFSDRKNRRGLVDHFCNVLSHLIVFKEDTGNPFRQLVLPLSHICSPVMNAIFALSSAHLEYAGIENEEKSLTFHNRALQGVAQLIEQNDPAQREEVLGAIILLVYYEVLVQKSNSNIVNGHLKGAMTIMRSGPRITTPAGLFLERAFRFYDVIAALSLGTSPNTNDQPTSTPFPDDQSLFSSPLSSVDTLLGLSTDLWPIIHRLSHLLSFKKSLKDAINAGEMSKATVLRTELENTSQAIEQALTTWKPTVSSNSSSPEDDEAPGSQPDLSEPRIQSILNNAEAYRNSAFVYLYRTIRSYPRNNGLVQKHTHLSLLACSNVVKNAKQCYDGPMSALLWPLFVAACVANTPEDRELAIEAFRGTERRQKMNNIMRAWEVVQEVWRRADFGDEDADWMSIRIEKGYNIVFG